MAPAVVVPAVLVLEILTSISVCRAAVRDHDMAWLTSLVTDNALCIPVGVYMLTHLDPLVPRLAVGTALLLTAAGLRWCDGTPLRTSRATKAGTGALSGILNGLAASGGVAAAVLMAARHVQAGAMRGTLILFLVFAPGYTLLWASVFSQGTGSGVDVFSIETLRWVLVLAPGMHAWHAPGTGTQGFSPQQPRWFPSFGAQPADADLGPERGARAVRPAGTTLGSPAEGQQGGVTFSSSPVQIGLQAGRTAIAHAIRWPPRRQTGALQVQRAGWRGALQTAAPSIQRPPIRHAAHARSP